MVSYGDVVAVDGVSFDVNEGEFVSLLGPSGCGKTTTLRCIAGLESAVRGEIRIGRDIVASDGREVPPEKRGVNMVFQSYAVWPHMSVFDNVAYGLRVQGASRADVDERTREALRLVGLAGYEDRFGTELSGGQQQRVAVARAVVTAPRLLLFDEPLSNLDAGLRERMRFELVALQRRLGRTSVYVTHDQSEAMVMSDRIILMNHGRIVQESSRANCMSGRPPASPPSSSAAPICRGTISRVAARTATPIGGRSATCAPAAWADAGVAPEARALVCIRPEKSVRCRREPARTSFAATGEAGELSRRDRELRTGRRVGASARSICRHVPRSAKA